MDIGEIRGMVARRGYMEERHDRNYAILFWLKTFKRIYIVPLYVLRGCN